METNKQTTGKCDKCEWTTTANNAGRALRVHRQTHSLPACPKCGLRHSPVCPVEAR